MCRLRAGINLLFENSNNLLFFEFGLFHRFLKVKLENQILTCMKKPATYLLACAVFNCACKLR
jgi:hypothetical protein